MSAKKTDDARTEEMKSKLHSKICKSIIYKKLDKLQRLLQQGQQYGIGINSQIVYQTGMFGCNFRIVTPLTLAVMECNLNITSWLLENGGDWHGQTFDPFDPLVIPMGVMQFARQHQQCNANYKPLIELLEKWTPESGTPYPEYKLHERRPCSDVDLRMLVNAIDRSDLEMVKKLDTEVTRNFRDSNGNYVVKQATKSPKQIEILKFLLNDDRAGKERFQNALVGCMRYQNFEAMKMVFDIASKHGLCLINCPITVTTFHTFAFDVKKGKYTGTPLELAGSYGTYEMIDWVLQNGGHTDANLEDVFNARILLGYLYDEQIISLIDKWFPGGIRKIKNTL